MKKSIGNATERIARSGLIAAIYVILTWVLGEFSYGPIQFRISEAMTVLPYCFPEATAGITVGCFLANLLSTAGPLDLIFGTAATLIGAIGTSFCRKIGKKYLAPLPPILANTLIIPAMLLCYAQTPSPLLYLTYAAQIALGETVCCAGIGLPILLLTEKRTSQSR